MSLDSLTALAEKLGIEPLSLLAHPSTPRSGD